MNKLVFLMILFSGISQADGPAPHELIIQHVPPSIEIIKQCGNATQRQSSQISSNENGISSSYSYSSALSVSSASTLVSDKATQEAKAANDCTLTIRTVKPCVDKACRQTIDFMPQAAPSKSSI